MPNGLKELREESKDKEKDLSHFKVGYSKFKVSEKKKSSLCLDYLFQQHWSIPSSEQSIFSPKDYLTGTPQNLISFSINEIIMGTLKKLEIKVEELSEKIENLSGNRKTKEKNIKKERIYIYFETRNEGIKILNYCQKQNLDVWPVAPGTLKIPYLSYVSELRNAGAMCKNHSINFGTMFH